MNKTTSLPLMTRLRNRSRTVGFALLLALVPVAGGCYGRFPLTKAVYKFNGDVENPIIRNVVFWLFAWFPVYGFAALIDAIVFNLIDFWSGRSIEINMTTQDGKTTMLVPSADGKEAVLTVSKDGKVLAEQRFIRMANGDIEVRSADGKLNGMVLKTKKGDLNLTDAQGRTMGTIPASALSPRGATL